MCFLQAGPWDAMHGSSVVNPNTMISALVLWEISKWAVGRRKRDKTTLAGKG